MIKSFEEMDVWKKSHQFVLKVHEVIKLFPSDEKYRIIDQLLRASVSIPTNIAEGTGRYSTKDYIRFLYIARGSLEEVKYLLFLSRDLKFLEDEIYEDLRNLLDEIGKMLNGLIASLSRSNP